MTLRATLTVLPICLSFLSTPALAQSLDCSKAEFADEMAICANKTLGNLDTEMATLWWVENQIPMAMGSRGAIHDEQTDFLAKRKACGGNTTCLSSAYRERITDMKTFIAGQMGDYCKAIQFC